jgi:hypothetical protein
MRIGKQLQVRSAARTYQPVLISLQRRRLAVAVLCVVPRLRPFDSLGVDPCSRVLYVLDFCSAFDFSDFSSDADIVCSRAKNHYDPQGTVDFSDSATQVDEGQAASSLEAFRRGFKPLHQSQSTLMYFS